MSVGWHHCEAATSCHAGDQGHDAGVSACLEAHLCPTLEDVYHCRLGGQTDLTPMRILCHCFGGISRSSAILCAWLIVAYDYTAEAIDLLLKKRPSLRPWRHRSYVLDALYCVDLETFSGAPNS